MANSAVLARDRIFLAKPRGRYGERQMVDVVRVEEWPSGLGALWGCDICGKRFKIGELWAEHTVDEDDVGQGPFEGRHWFSRIHVWHYEVVSRSDA